MRMNKTIKVAATLTVAGVLALTGCGGDSERADDGGDDPQPGGLLGARAGQQGRHRGFEDTDAGKDVDFKESYGASGDQSRAVVAGAKADEVHLSLEPDVTRLVDEGLVAEDWKDNDTKGICTNSVVVFVVQQGQPQGHRDLGRPRQARRRHRDAEPGLLRLGQVEPPRGVRRGEATRVAATRPPRST